MASSLNKIMLIGNVGREPEMRYTPSGTAVTTFSIATNRRVNKNDQWEDEVEWHNIVCFEKLAEQMNEYLAKGRKVYVEGRLQTRSWEDKDSGEKKYRTETVAQVCTMLDKNPESGDGEQRSAPAARRPSAPSGGPRNGPARPAAKRAAPVDDNVIDLDETPF